MLVDGHEVLNVNRDDIAWAKRQDRWGCAIVRAIQREHPEALFVRADKEVIAYSEFGHRYEHTTPDDAIEKIIKPLDEGKDIEPFSFVLPPATVREVTKITPEKKRQLRQIDRDRTSVEKAARKAGNRTRTANRFCE